MKKSVIILLLLFSLHFSSSAFAEEPQFVTTQNFLAAADSEKGISYTLGSPIADANGTHYDLVRLTYKGDASPYTSNITLLFNESEDRVQLMMYNLINFAEEDSAEVLDEINMLNRQISGIKLYVDDSDYSITVEMYMFVTESTVADATLSAIGFMIGKTDAIYDMLKEYSI